MSEDAVHFFFWCGRIEELYKLKLLEYNLFA